MTVESRWPKESELVFEKVSCPICLSNESSAIWKEPADCTWFRSGIKKEVSVAKCAKCGFIFTNPQPTSETRMLFYSPETNPDLLKRKATCGFDLRQQLRWLALYYDILKSIGDYRQKGKLLEIGVAGGLFLLAASDSINHPKRPLNFELEGIAIDKQEAEQAKNVTGLNIHHGKIEEWQTENKYDVIVAINVLEHIPNLREVVGKVYQLLEPDGIFSFVVPNNYFFDNSLWQKLKARNPTGNAVMACEHINHFTAKTMEHLMLNQNFKKVEFRPLADLRTRDWERKFSLNQVVGYKDYWISKITKRPPMTGYLFGLAFK